MYELWDSESLNMVDSFGSVAEVESAIAATIALSGVGAITPLVLVREDENGETETVAEGGAILVATRRLLAVEQAATNQRRSA